MNEINGTFNEHTHGDLRIRIQGTDAVFLLVTQVLTDCLCQRFFHIRSLALNYAKRNTIHEQYQIRSVMLLAVASHYAEFFGYMKYIVL